MVRKARCRSTCEHASKRVDFCRSRCCFADAMDAKFVQNRRKSSMATCNVSTVVPAARRANSKCIDLKKWISMISQRFLGLGNLGVNLIQPPKFCAGLIWNTGESTARVEGALGTWPDAPLFPHAHLRTPSPVGDNGSTDTTELPGSASVF